MPDEIISIKIGGQSVFTVLNELKSGIDTLSVVVIVPEMTDLDGMDIVDGLIVVVGPQTTTLKSTDSPIIVDELQPEPKLQQLVPKLHINLKSVTC